MSTRLRTLSPHLVALLLVIVLVLARYLGWLSDPPPLLAPGIR